jgi:hypothetical protein
MSDPVQAARQAADELERLHREWERPGNWPPPEDVQSFVVYAKLLRALAAAVDRLTRERDDAVAALEAYKEATGIVQDVARADAVDRALHQEAERAAALTRERDALRDGVRDALSIVGPSVAELRARMAALLAPPADGAGGGRG